MDIKIAVKLRIYPTMCNPQWCIWFISLKQNLTQYWGFHLIVDLFWYVGYTLLLMSLVLLGDSLIGSLYPGFLPLWISNVFAQRETMMLVTNCLWKQQSSVRHTKMVSVLSSKLAYPLSPFRNWKMLRPSINSGFCPLLNIEGSE